LESIKWLEKVNKGLCLILKYYLPGGGGLNSPSPPFSLCATNSVVWSCLIFNLDAQPSLPCLIHEFLIRRKITTVLHIFVTGPLKKYNFYLRIPLCDEKINEKYLCSCQKNTASIKLISGSLKKIPMGSVIHFTPIWVGLDTFCAVRTGSKGLKYQGLANAKFHMSNIYRDIYWNKKVELNFNRSCLDPVFIDGRIVDNILTGGIRGRIRSSSRVGCGKPRPWSVTLHNMQLYWWVL